MKPAYYNEIDPYAAQWLRNLIAAGHLPPGDVDDRSIVDVRPADLAGYGQCHFFAGIGGGALACKLAGWPGDRVIWTGGPPCQDSSVGAAIHGRRTGLRGERSGLAHVWLDLVDACRPDTVVFENVPGIAPWLAEITGRLEGFGYAVSQSERTAAGSGAPHLRRRVWVSADRDGARLPVARPGRSPETSGGPWGTPPGDLWREVKPGTWRLDDGVSARMAQLRAFGNAWVPQEGAEVIRALLPKFG